MILIVGTNALRSLNLKNTLTYNKYIICKSLILKLENLQISNKLSQMSNDSLIKKSKLYKLFPKFSKYLR